MAAIGRDEQGTAADVAAVVQPEVAGHAGENHQIGVSERLAPTMAVKRRMVRTEQSARHPGQPRRYAQRPHGLRDVLDPGGVAHGLAADDEDGLASLRQARGDVPHALLVDPGRRRCRGVSAAPGRRRREDLPQVVADVGLLCLAREAPAGLVGAVPVPHQRFRVEEIDGALDEYRTGHAAARHGEGLVDGAGEVAHTTDDEALFHVRFHQRDLVDVLQRAPALQDRRRRAAQHDDGRLGKLSVLDRGDCVGEARASRYRRDAGHTGDAGRRVRSEDGGGFVPGVDDPQPEATRG